VNDTTSEIERKVRELMMSLSGAQRMKISSDMFATARSLVMASFSPSLSPIEAKVHLCERLYSGEVDLAAFSAAQRRLPTGQE
jgi:hypothetical protein